MNEVQFFREILPKIKEALNRKDYVNIGRDKITFSGNTGYFVLRVDAVQGIGLTISGLDNDPNYYNLTAFHNGDLFEEYRKLYYETIKVIQKEDYYKKGAELLKDLIGS